MTATTSNHRTTPSLAPPAPDRPLRGRRISCEEFYRHYPTARKPANDNMEDAVESSER